MENPHEKKLIFQLGLFCALFLSTRAFSADKVLRTVTLAPSLTTFVVASGGASTLVGVSHFSALPDGVRAVDVGVFTNPDIEKVIGLKPDLVLASTEGNPPFVVYRLKERGVRVKVISVKKLEDVLSNMRLLSEIFGTQKQVKEKISEMREILKMPGCGNKSAALFLQTRPPMVAGKDTYLNDFLNKAGLTNAFSFAKRYFYVSIEELIDRSPEVLIFSEGNDREYLKSVLPQARAIELNSNQLFQPGPETFKALKSLKEWCRREGI